MDDQQFCLRWNNHQSTLVSVFEKLLESGTLVDCTVAAEGQYLKAHKVVLSACSPYFEILLRQLHNEKHPVFILKDVKFQELRAMMDYMYKGEVNISQDQLGALLKAAESLQIKGLSDSGGGGTEKETVEKRQNRKHSLAHSRSSPVLQNSTTVDSKHPPIVDLPEDSPPPSVRMNESRDGSVSPIHKRKKLRRRSSGEDEASSLGVPNMPSTSETRLENSGSCDMPQAQTIPIGVPPAISSSVSSVVPAVTVAKPPPEPTIVPDPPSIETELNRPGLSISVAVPNSQTLTRETDLIQEKIEPSSEVLLQPKSEYVEDLNEDSVEDLTLDDDDDMTDLDQSRPGPSHGQGSGNSFAQWHMASDRSTDEVFMAAQEAVGAHRDSQDIFFKLNERITNETHRRDYDILSKLGNSEDISTVIEMYKCPRCDRTYQWRQSLALHLRLECGKEPKFSCPYCDYRCKQKGSLCRHINVRHNDI